MTVTHSVRRQLTLPDICESQEASGSVRCFVLLVQWSTESRDAVDATLSVEYAECGDSYDVPSESIEDVAHSAVEPKKATRNSGSDSKPFEGLWAGSWGGGEADGVAFRPVKAEMLIEGGFPCVSRHVRPLP